MLKIIFTAILLLAVPAGGQAGPADWQIYTAGGQPVALEELAGLLDDDDVIIFGEYHDNAVLHELERVLLDHVFQKQPKLAVSLEMFERDVQVPLDAYLAESISEQGFLAQSRPWQNYQADYRPLVEFARANALPVIAANIPRQVAAHYAREGSLAGLPAAQAVYLPQFHLAPEGEYRRRFIKELTKPGQDAKMPVNSANLENYYKAQCLKDDTMAESIVKYRQRRPDDKVIHYQGDFHSRGWLGVVEKLHLLDATLKVAVITPVYVSNLTEPPTSFEQYQNDGDIIVFLRQNEEI